MIYINKHLENKKEVERNEQNFPLLFRNDKQVKDIDIRLDEITGNIYIQTTLKSGKLIKSYIEDFIEQTEKQLKEQVFIAQQKLNALESVKLPHNCAKHPKNTAEQPNNNRTETAVKTANKTI